jgi:hypothetical protein
VTGLVHHVRVARALTDFDSSVNMVRALGRFLREKGHGGLSVGPSSRWLADALSALPHAVRRRAFTAMGWMQGIPPRRAHHIDAEGIAQWVVDQYQGRDYPVAVVGAPSGAVLHLAAALRAPYLPQTVLVSVRDRATDPDDPAAAMTALAPTTRAVAARNPDLAVYHMHDPAQDRPMLETMAYLRLKRRRLGRTYERFLSERLAPGATIVLSECTRDWRSTTVGERAYFQFGCLGGVPEEEYHNSGERIAHYLAEQGSPWRRWEPPKPDGRRPEAEWGFDPAIRPDVADLAARCGYHLRRLVVHEPQDGSGMVAELYRWWYRRLGLPGDRLLVETYVQWEPLLVLRLGAVPFWSRFNMEPSYQVLRRYLDGTEPYREIHLNLFSHGLCSPGTVPVPQWRELVASRAGERGEVIGVDEASYPTDLGATSRYEPAFAALPARHPLPPPLPIADIDGFVNANPGRWPVQWRCPSC